MPHRSVLLPLLLRLLCLVTPSTAFAHGPGDMSARLEVLADHIDIHCVMGTDVVRALFPAAGLSTEDVRQSLIGFGPDQPVEHPIALGLVFFELKTSADAVPPIRVTSYSDGMEVHLTISHPRPANATRIELRATCRERDDKLSAIPLAVHPGGNLRPTIHLLGDGQKNLVVPLPAVEAPAE